MDYITENCGILVEPESPWALVIGFANAMLVLADDPLLCHRMGTRRRQRVFEEFDWDKKLDQIPMIYNLLISSKSPRPSVYDMEIFSWDRPLKKV